MVEELQVEEKAEVTPEEETALEAEQTPEPISEIPGAEVSPESSAVTETVQELAELVKSCVVEGKTCEHLGRKFDDIAKELGIGFNELLDRVFEIARKQS